MKKQNYFVVAIMLWMFSSVSFASMIEPTMVQSPVLSLSFTEGKVSTGLTISVLDHNSFMLAEDFIHSAFGHIGSFGGDFGHEHHGYHEPDKCDVPAAVPLPAAVWLFGSVIAGFLGVCRKTSSKAMVA